MGFANPFQIYFLVWSLLILNFYLQRDSFVEVTSEFLFLVFTVKSVALVLLIGVHAMTSSVSEPLAFERLPPIRERLLLIAQIVVFAAVPFAYLRAVSLAGGDDIFSIAGYIGFRSAMTDDGESFGIFSYLSILSLVTSSITIASYFERRAGAYRLATSILVSLFYAYVSTARTFILIFFLLLIFPMVLTGIVRLKGLLVALVLMGCAFVFVAVMTAKGVSIEADVAGNADSLFENLRQYTVAPFVAFSRLVTDPLVAELGLNSFRLAFSVLNALGVADVSPKALIREYAYVPDATNVYTVYEVYFRDFLFLGIFIPPMFLIGHWWLYRKARGVGGRWIFYYSASVYPLVMQFFQDQYFSLLSMWIQLGFWYWLFLSTKFNPEKNSTND